MGTIQGEKTITEGKKLCAGNRLPRVLISIALIAVQTIALIAIVRWLRMYFLLFRIIWYGVAVWLVLNLFHQENRSSNVRMIWLLLILLMPVAGIVLYLLYGRGGGVCLVRQRDAAARKLTQSIPVTGSIPLNELEQKSEPEAARVFRYLETCGGFPVYPCDHIVYHKKPIDGLYDQIEQMKAATKFIFIEYYAIADTHVFGLMAEVLKEKANENVEVRIIYDDVGSMGFLNHAFDKKMASCGIQIRTFGKIRPVVSGFWQNRDHRKVIVVDGIYGCMAGYNLADEYFGFAKCNGEWKDTGAGFQGPAVAALTRLFLEMWNSIDCTDTDLFPYFPELSGTEAKGWIQPFGTNPLLDENLAENVCLNLIQQAKTSLYLMTPYLILDSAMQEALTLAAKRGVDVRILIPGIPDKKLVFQLTCSYAQSLRKAGVRIYEYTPGFCHAKQILVDETTALIGTINLDFRSLWYHFENALLMYQVPVLTEIRQDFVDSMQISEEMKSEEPVRPLCAFALCLLRFLAPLL